MSRMKINAEISAQVLEKLDQGLPLPDAFDAVLGAGEYKRFAAELYAEFHAKAIARTHLH